MADQDLPEFEFSDEFMREISEQAEQQAAQQAAQQASGQDAQQASGQAARQAADTPSQQHSEPDANPSPTSSGETKFFAWQVCHADMETQSLVNADDFADYIVNRETITQMLGIGMASGQNAFPLNDQMFVVAVSEQIDGEIRLISPDFPRYREIAALISEKLLQGEDHGMLAELPNGNLIAIKQPM